MNRLILTLSIMLLGFAGSIVAADSLTGRVVDSETGNLVQGVNIHVVGSDIVVETDHHGIFRIEDIPAGQFNLLATHVAYDTATVGVEQAGNLEIKITPKPWVLNEVVVTGTRTPHLLKNVPVQTEVVTRRDFQRTGATTVDEALTSSIGININEDFSGQGATIRGIEGERVLVLIDGERAVGRVNGSLDLGQYSLTNVEKIEVVKGTGSTLYGSDAMGGVVNIITRNPGLHTGRLNAYMDYGTYSSLNPSVEGEWGNGRVGVTFGGKYYATQGFDLDKSTPHTNGLEEIGRLNLNGKARFRLSNRWNLTGSARYMRERKDWVESEVWPGNLLFVYDDEEINNRIEVSAGLAYLSGDKYSMNFRLYGTQFEHNWNKYDRETGNWLDTSETKDVFYEASYNSNYVIGSGHVMTYGFDYNYQDLRSSELATEKEADRAGDAYLQYEYSPWENFNILPGVRYENHSSFGGKVNPSFNVMYRPSESLKLRGFVGGGYRAPSIKQQYFVFDHSSAGYIVYGGMVDLPDDIVFPPGLSYNELKDENSINSSISAEFSYGTIGLHRMTYFYNHLNDLIEFIQVGSSAEYWRGIYVYQNIERAVTQGVEWESRVRLSKAIDFSFSYNYLWNVVLDTDVPLLDDNGNPVVNENTGDTVMVESGNKLVNRPAHTFKFFLTGYYEKLGVGATFWGNYHSRKLWTARSNTGEQDGEPVYAPHRTTLNLNFFKRFDQGLELFVRLENLLDEENLEFGYWPGLQVFAGATYNLDMSEF